MTSVLADICARKREHIASRKRELPEGELRHDAKHVSPPRGFKAALEDKIKRGGTALIAEIKKASPSGGLIRADFKPAALARAYEQGGAACLSVLTDAPYFQGDDDYLAQARAATSLPVLRKDFMLDPYQIYESRALGADCVLIIMAALSDTEAAVLYDVALDTGMDALVEVHDRAELERALKFSPMMIGINNRDLKTLNTDLATSELLAKYLPAPILGVCESGIASHADIGRMKTSGFSCFLVGESLMREQDVATATQRLLGTG